MSTLTVAGIRRRFLLMLGLRWLSFGLVLPLLVLMAQERGLTLAEIGLVLATYGITTAVLELPTGGLADSIGRRKVLVLSAVLQLILYGVVLIATSTALFAVGFMIGGVSRALDSGPLEAWFVDRTYGIDSTAELRGSLSAGGVVSGIALAIGAVAGGLIPAITGGRLELAVWAAVGAGVVYLVSIPMLMTSDHRSGADPISAAVARIPRLIAEGVHLGIGDRSLRLLLGGMAGLGFGLGSLELLWQPRFVYLLDGDTVNTGPLGFVLAGAFALAAVGSALTPWITRRLKNDPRRTAFTGRFTMGGAVVLLAWTGRFEIAAVAFLVAYFSNGVAGPVESELLHAQVDEGVRTTVLSVQSMTLQGGGLMAGIGLGALADAAGITASWMVGAVVLALSSLLYLRVEDAGEHADAVISDPANGSEAPSPFSGTCLVMEGLTRVGAVKRP